MRGAWSRGSPRLEPMDLLARTPSAWLRSLLVTVLTVTCSGSTMQQCLELYHSKREQQELLIYQEGPNETRIFSCYSL